MEERTETVCARVLYEYCGVDDDELDLRVGDILNNFKELREGWSQGELNGKLGLFPSDFVEVITPVQTAQEPSPDEVCAKVLYDYSGGDDDELILHVGDIVNKFKDRGGGWSQGELNGKVGLFPSSVVEIITVKTAEEDSSGIKTKVCARVLYDHFGEDEDELVLHVGDILRNYKDLGKGWSQGELHGKVGLFPSNFVEVITAAKPDSFDERDTSFEGGKSFDKRDKSFEGDKEESFDEREESNHEREESYHDVEESSHDVVYAKVLEDYYGEDDDELVLLAGEIVNNVEDRGSGWMQGELNGKFGLFLSSHVEVITSVEQAEEEYRIQTDETTTSLDTEDTTESNNVDTEVGDVTKSPVRQSPERIPIAERQRIAERSDGVKTRSQTAQIHMAVGRKSETSSEPLKKEDEEEDEEEDEDPDNKETDQKNSSSPHTSKVKRVVSTYKHHIGGREAVSIHFMLTVQCNKLVLKERDRIVIFFGHPTLGSFKKPFVEMQRDRGLSSSFVLWVGRLVAPKLLFKSQIPYKYAICTDEKTHWESLCLENYAECNRILHLSEGTSVANEIYQVDGCIVPSFNSPMANQFFKAHTLYSWREKLMDFRRSHFPEIFRLYLNADIVDDVYGHMLFMKGVVHGFFGAYARSITYGQVHHFRKLGDKYIEVVATDAIRTMKEGREMNYTSMHAKMQFIIKVLTIACYMEDLATDKRFLSTLIKSLSLEDIQFDGNAELFYNTLNNVFPQEEWSMLERVLCVYWMKGLHANDRDLATSIWYPLVIIHAISGRCLLFEEPAKKITDINGLSCGLCVQKHYFYEPFLDKLFGNLVEIKNSLQMDKLLQRTILFIMKPSHYELVIQSGYFSPCLLLEMVAYHTRVGYLTRQQIDPLTNVLFFAQNIVETAIPLEERFGITDALIDIARSCIKDYDVNSSTVTYFEILIASLQMNFSHLEKVQVNLAAQGVGIEEFNKRVGRCLPVFFTDVENCFKRSGNWNMLAIDDINMIIQVATKLYDLNFEALREKIIEMFYHQLGQLREDRKFFQLFSGMDTEKLPVKIQSAFENIFSQKLEAIARDSSSWKSTWLGNIWRSSDLDVLCTFFSKEWEKKKTPVECIYHCMNWPPMRSFFDAYGKNKHGGNMTFHKSIHEASMLLIATASEIMDLSISVETMEMLQKREETFFELYSLLVKNGQESLLPYFQKNCEKVNKLRNGIAVIDYFIEICRVIPDQFCDLERLKGLINADVDVLHLSDIFYGEYGVLEYFGVSQDFWSTMQHLYNVKIGESSLFKDCLELSITYYSGTYERFTENVLMENVVRPAIVEARKVFVEIMTGNTKKSQVVKNLKNTKMDNLYIEFVLLRESFQLDYPDQHMRDCIARIQTVFAFERCMGTAQKIKVLAETFNLNGDFDNVRKIAALATDAGDLCLKDIDDGLMKDMRQISNISRRVIEIISHVESSLNLFIWLRENLKGPQEVKVFVDMMSISAGEADFEVDRVKCFEASCLAFGPIIFDLKETTGFNTLVQACNGTEKNVGDDKRIIEKLIDTNRNLEWFKDAKKSQGSVETRSLKEAIDANKSGCYTVGNFHHNKFLREEVTLKEVIKLRIAKVEKSHEKELSLEQIHDLQSRLMLLGGEIDDQTGDNMTNEKRYFVQMSEIITRLAKVYVALIELGDIEYFDWSKEVRCNIDEATHMGMEEYFENQKVPIVKLENHLKVHQEKIVKYRENNPCLNHLTVKQVLILQRYLYLATEDIKNVTKLPSIVFTLLKSIAEDVSVVMVENAMIQSFTKRRNVRTDTWKMADTENRSNFTDMSYAELENVVQRLESKFKIIECIAYAALYKIYPYDERKALMWCRKQTISDVIHEMAEKAEKEMKLKEKAAETEEVEVDVVMEDDTKDNEPVKFMPLEQVGVFLNALQRISKGIKSKKTDERRERRPENLIGDKPSLIILPQDEILYAILYMYLGYQRGLPSPQDVLLCNEDVSMEQIELLIRRASDDELGLYCMAFVDHLEYEVNVQTFTFIEKQIKQGVMNNLVIFCCKENENKSFLVSALDQCKVSMPLTYCKENIPQLLQKQLLPNQSDCKDDVEYAAKVDIEGYDTRLITSNRGGMGKSLFASERVLELELALQESKKYSNKSKGMNKVITIPVQGSHVDTKAIVELLLQFEEKVEDVFPRIYHFDVSPVISHGLDCFLFNIVVLGYIQTRTGKVWRKNSCDLCIIEVTMVEAMKATAGVMVKMLPTYTCISPVDAYDCLKDDPTEGVHGQVRRGINERAFKDKPIQRVYQYLKVYDSKGDLNTFTYQEENVDTDHKGCLEILLRYCGVDNPSWMELRNFVHFFNEQLVDSEQSVYTSPIMNEDLRGFKAFTVKFLLMMAKDFATRSITEGEGEEPSVMVQMKRRWEHSSHPYLFFNQDHATLSFVGFNITPEGNITNLSDSTQVICNDVKMPKELYQDLMRQMAKDEYKLRLDTDYRTLSREQKLVLLCRVMGVKELFDPDKTYELTMDNVTKILAIQMRIRCGIPVILMGETGCGKTRMIRFMCSLNNCKMEKNEKTNEMEKVRNMYLVKVHGGVTAQDLLKRIHEVKEIAKQNLKKYGVSTILFLDEANTTSGVDVINEVMVDKRAEGKPLMLEENGLQIIAACNPYRRHSDNMVEKLESAGLGYHVSAALTYEKIGDIPLRQLVYRVHQLPESMKPLVWDFGQLTAEAEQAYAKQIIDRYKREGRLPPNDEFVKLLVSILPASQVFMRDQKDECSFVSLRDVERAVQVCSWFYTKFDFLKKFEESALYKIKDDNDRLRRSLVLALGVCYVARLEKREEYIEYISKKFTGKFQLKNGAMQMKAEIMRCQKTFVKNLNLDENIAMNNALCENVFMMVICIELRIPLFVVGKPGSSKSLAKTIVQDNMQGYLSKSKLFCGFKQIFMSSYQCSPLSTAEGIINVFKQCSRFQQDKNLDEYASVVVLDEVGLAEDSPAMPLKALHPLLEDGTDGSEDLTIVLKEEELATKRCSFIGISNWSLDPAKMNRGIMLCRGSPDEVELINTARDICGGDKRVQTLIKPLLKPLSRSYLNIYYQQKDNLKLVEYKKKEFFGLRDFYSLIKMVFCFARKHQGIPPLERIEHAVRRNFSGLQGVDAWTEFNKNNRFRTLTKEPDETDEDSKNTNTTIELIRACLERSCSCYEGKSDATRTRCTNVRYLLVMTEKYSALPLIQELFLETEEEVNVIFGSSFPRDQHFTQVCRSINRIKMYMETGKTVILLNMENLYESLYDALNQYYVYLGGQSYVDLGLGTHRVKCRVHDDFRLIVIADRETVYRSFPIPLINRLEKHFLVTATCLTPEEMKIATVLQEWVRNYAVVKTNRLKFSPPDAFIGYNEDTCASMVMMLCKNAHRQDQQEEILESCKKRLLFLATPDSIARLSKSNVKAEASKLWQVYFEEQEHSSLSSFLKKYLGDERPDCSFIQVTTFSKLISPADKETLDVGVDIELISLMQFQTEHAFQEEIKSFLSSKRGRKSLLIIQCIYSANSINLVTCAQHICKEAMNVYGNTDKPVYFLFLLQLSHLQGGYKGITVSQSVWKCIHIDELRPPTNDFPSLLQYAGHTLSSLFDSDEIKDAKQYSEVTHLIRGCIPTAINKLCGLKEMSISDISNAISILSKIMGYVNAGYYEDEGDFSQKFVKNTLKHISNCLKKKEDEALTNTGDVDNWIYQEAIGQKHTQDYGTFREALIRCVEDRIIDIFTALLFEIDHGKNLMLSTCESYQNIWVGLYKSAVKDIPLTNDVPQRIKEPFSRRFPFSKQLIQSYEDVMKTYASQDISLGSVVQLTNVVNTQAFGTILTDLDQNQVKDYIHDLIHTKFTCQQERGYELLAQGLLLASKELLLRLNGEQEEEDEFGEEIVEMNVKLDLLLVHCAFLIYDDRLQHANVLLTMHPTIARYIFNNVNEDGDEMVLDMHALIAVLERLDPLKHEAFLENQYSKWLTYVKHLKITAGAQLSCGKKIYGPNSSLLKDHCRILWTRLQIIQMYLDITTPHEEEKQKFHQESVAEFIKCLSDIDDDMRSIGSWNVVEVFLRRVINEAKYKSRKTEVDYEEFEKRCITFFVELVSQFCFARDFEEIDDDLIFKFMGYAFHTAHIGQTKLLSPTDQYVDTTPVIRSYILQQLLKKTDDVDVYVERFLKDNLKFAKTDQDTWDICKLFIYCCEDNLFAEISLLIENYEAYIGEVAGKLEEACGYLEENSFEDIRVELLENIATARVSLVSVASILATKFLPQVTDLGKEAEANLKNLVAVLNRFVLAVKNNEGHMFLYRQIIHQCGSGDLEKILQNSRYEFLRINQEVQDDREAPSEPSSATEQTQASEEMALTKDLFLVYNTPYQTLKNRISEITLNKGKGREKDTENLIQTSQHPPNDKLIRLAIKDNAGNEEDVVDKRKSICDGINDKDIAQMLYHLMVLLHFNPAGSLVSHLVNDSGRLKECYFPAMPGDPFLEVSGLNKQVGMQSFLFHQCPNGHPYVITECGRAWTRTNCPECGAPIGGAVHNLDAGNVILATDRDNSEKGHCIGDYTTRLLEATPERDIPPMSTILQYTLMHLSMLLGTIIGNKQCIVDLILPNIQPNEVETFLINHIMHDIRSIGKVFGKSTDKSIIIIHLLLKHLGQVQFDVDVLDMLKSVEGRKMYETQFHRVVIEDFVKSVSHDVNQSEVLILNEMTVKSNPVTRRIYELDPVPLPPVTDIDIASCNQFWMYRQPITHAEFKLQVQVTVSNTNGGTAKTLWKFLQQENVFTLISGLPGLLELQRILLNQFSYRMDTKTAAELSIKDALEQLPKGTKSDASMLVSSFIKLWNDLSPLLKEHGRLRPDPAHHLESISKKTSLQYFLCKLKGPGRFAMAMMDFLTFKHNEFLEYCSSVFGFAKPPTVTLLKVKPDDLILYKAERELLPIIVGFCDYSSEIGKGSTEVQYNMEAIERHFIEKLFFGRSQVVFLAEEFRYRDEVHSSQKFKLLQDAIKQNKIPQRERKSMMGELAEIGDVSNALRCVEIAIGFLTSTGGDPNVLYKTYISTVLHMNVQSFIPSKKMQTNLRLTHMLSTWIMLQVEKTRRLHLSNQNPFFMEKHFTVELDEETKVEVTNELSRADALDLLDLLTEYIVTELSQREENAAELPLLEALQIYEDLKVGATKVNMGAIPDEIQLMHIHSFWKQVVDFSVTIIEIMN